MPETKIGKTYKLNKGGTAIVGQISYDWAFTVPHYFPVGGSITNFGVGYQDTATEQYYNLNGAWGQWASGQTFPTVIDLRPYLAAAGTYSNIGISQGWFDDTMGWGSEHFNSLDEWNAFLDRCDQYISWVFGNTRDGGMGFIKYDSSRWVPVATYGVYENAAGQQKIAAWEGNPDFTTTLMAEGCMVQYYGVNGDHYSDVCWVTKTPASPAIYVINNPEQTLGNITWKGSEVSGIANTFDNTTTPFGDGRVSTTLIMLGSVCSPYGDTRALFAVSRTITAEGYEKVGGDIDSNTTEMLANGGNAGDNNGDGDYDNSSDEIDFPDDSQFAIDAQSSGFVTVFEPSKSTIQDFASWLYGDLPTNYGTWLDSIGKLQKNPMDAIISLNLAHYEASTSGSEPINFFGRASGYSAPVVSKLTNILDCGSVWIHEYSGNFLDYGGKSTIRAFIPYCGMYTLSTNEVMGAELRLKYYIDILSGACIAQLKVIRQRSSVYADPNMKAIIYSFTGNIFQQIPITAVDYSNIMRGQLNLAAGAASLATGNIVGGITSLANTAISMSPSVERVGSYGSSYGYMGYQKPFIIQEYPWYNFPSKYDNYYGRPLYDYKYLSACDGYTEVDSGTLWTDKFDWITSEEEQILKQMCDTGGIYIDHTSAYYDYDPED